MTTDFTDGQIEEIGLATYLYLYPLVTMEVTRRQMTNLEQPQGMRAPTNVFGHNRAFPPAGFRDIVRPNFDTLYSSVWLDLGDGPIVVSAGEVPDGRFYHLPMYDMWTDCFAAPGERTSGTGPGAWAVVPPGWSGVLPDGVDRIDAPTPTVWMIGRTQTNGPADYPTVHAFQDDLRLTPLASWGQAEVPVPTGTLDPDIDMTPPVELVNAMTAPTFFDTALALLAKQPPHLTDGPIVMQMQRLGLVPGASFDGLDPRVQKLLAGVPEDGVAAMRAALPTLAKVVNGWQLNTDTIGVYGNTYLKRAVVAMVGLGANSPEDAVYPLLLADADGNPLNGDHDYVLHFAAGELPPVRAFWSVTMYDGEGFHAANELDRFAIGDRDELSYNADGSLDLYLQRTPPAADKRANWLPSTHGPLGVTMRLYSPRRAVLDGSWAPPPVRRV